MRSNNRQRSRGGRNGGGGGGGGHHHKQHHNPNRPPNRNQIFDSSGPDVRVRGNAHQVLDKYQALAREAAASGDRIQAEAYWQYADHYFRVIQSMGGLVQRNNQGWGDGTGDETGQPGQQPQQAPQGNGNGHVVQGEGPASNREESDEAEAGLGGVAFLQSGRTASTSDNDPGGDEQPDIPEYVPGSGRRG